MNRPRYGHGAVPHLVHRYLARHPNCYGSEVAAAIDARPQVSQRALRRLVRDGDAVEDLYGRYRLAGSPPADPPAEPHYAKGGLEYLVRQFLVEHPDSRDGEVATAHRYSRQASNKVLRRLLRQGVASQDIYGRYRLVEAP